MIAPIEFKSQNLNGELRLADPRLRVVVYYAATVSQVLFGKPLIVTRIESHRSEVEDFYGAGAKVSVHEVHPCRGADVHTHGYYSDIEVVALVGSVNYAFEYRSGGGIYTALHETVEVMRRLGRVNPTESMVHLHLQVPPVPSGESNKVRLWWPV